MICSLINMITANNGWVAPSPTSREGPPLQGATSLLRPTCHYSETDAARLTKLAMDVGEVQAIS